MALFEELCKIDVIGPIEDLIHSGVLSVNFDGKIELKSLIKPTAQWLVAKGDTNRLCSKWYNFYVLRYNIIPKGCRKCWKVGIQVSNLDELFKLKLFQQDEELPSKCGIELRPKTGKLRKYVGFWYSPLEGGLDWARNVFKDVVTRVAEAGIKGTLSLKRGCTELEEDYPPSDSWDQLAEERMFDQREAMLDDIFINPPALEKLPWFCDVNTQLHWIQLAAEVGDETYRIYTDRDFAVKTLDYQDSNHSGKDFPGLEMTDGQDNNTVESKGLQNADASGSENGLSPPKIITKL